MSNLVEFYEKDTNARFNGYMADSIKQRAMKTYTTRFLNVSSLTFGFSDSTSVTESYVLYSTVNI